jgi:ribosomal-protein-alanine N-acetyltransferase
MIALRSASPADGPVLEAVERAAAHRPWTRDAIDRHLAEDGPRGLVALEQGRVVGHLLGAVAADEAELHTLAVHPTARRKGIGASLLRAAEAAWRDAGATAAWLEVRADNAPARALYLRAGWVETGVRRGYYADGCDGVVMRRDLSGPPERALSPDAAGAGT